MPLRNYDFEYKQTVVPTVEPVTLAELTAHILGFNTADNTYATGLIPIARQRFEDQTGLAIIAQTWELSFSAFQDVIKLNKGPVRSISSVTYYDQAGDQQTLASSVYRSSLKEYSSTITLAFGQSWPAVEADRADAVTITFIAGIYTTTGASPDAVDTASASYLVRKYAIAQQSIKIMCHHMYDNRAPTITGTIISSVDDSYNAMVQNCKVST